MESAEPLAAVNIRPLDGRYDTIAKITSIESQYDRKDPVVGVLGYKTEKRADHPVALLDIMDRTDTCAQVLAQPLVPCNAFALKCSRLLASNCLTILQWCPTHQAMCSYAAGLLAGTAAKL